MTNDEAYRGGTFSGMDEAIVRALHARGRAAWPHVTVELSAYASHVAALALDGDSKTLEALHAEDLYLACACARGDASAIATFEREFLCDVPAYIARATTAPQVVDEVLQRLRERLLVSTAGATPKIATYTGRGPLGAFLRVTAVRLAYDTLPSDRAARLSTDPEVPVDPELDYIKSTYRAQFVRAIEQAIATLPARERNAMALSLIDGLSTDAIGRMYGKDGATVRRWLGSARAQILDETKKLLRAELGATPEELQSLLGILHSRLDVSIARILRESRDTG
jgi:RNA polymerase sigma-70 factor, ECF subfamily